MERSYFLTAAIKAVGFSIFRVFTPFSKKCELIYGVGFFLFAGIDVIACCQFSAAMPCKARYCFQINFWIFCHSSKALVTEHVRIDFLSDRIFAQLANDFINRIPV